MKKLVVFLLVAFGSICLFSSVSAQDLMYKKNKEVIRVKVVEVGLDEIKFKYWDDQKGPVYVVDKNDLIKIEFENGKVEYYTDPMENADLYKGQRKHALKTGFLAPAMNHVNLSFQSSIKPGMSYEVTLGIIGVGNQYEYDDRGAYLKLGWVVSGTPSFYRRGTRYTHLLKGPYLKPELIIGSHTTMYYSWNPSTGSVDIPSNVNFAAFIVNTGFQNVYADRLMIDYSIGLGYAGVRYKKPAGAVNSDNYYGDPFHYAFIGGDDFPIAFTFGLRLGLLIK